MAFKDYLKRHRVEAGLTQRELAERSGVSYSYLTKLEAGEQANPSYEILEALGKELGVPLGAAYDFGDPMDDNVMVSKSAARIGQAYERATPPVQRTVEVALEPFMDEGNKDGET